jgi:gamma-glutamyltranspeptidase/glutathione hydrolase
MKNFKIIITLSVLSLLMTYGCSTLEISEGKSLVSSKAMVVSAHPEASRIGAEILAAGGNAIDAAVAVQFALAVCYPSAGNIGGGGFMVIRFSDGSVDALDFREKAPGLADRDMFLDDAGEVVRNLSTETHLASGVPGSVDGMAEAHSRYGKLPWKRLVQPSVDLAEKGFIIAGKQADALNSMRRTLNSRNRNKDIRFVRESPWKPGDLLIQPELAQTLAIIRDKGRDGFYQGQVADLIVEEMKRGNGIISHEDLRNYRSEWRAPLSGKYREEYEIISMAPPSSGGVALLQLWK